MKRILPIIFTLHLISSYLSAYSQVNHNFYGIKFGGNQTGFVSTNRVTGHITKISDIHQDTMSTKKPDLPLTTAKINMFIVAIQVKAALRKLTKLSCLTNVSSYTLIYD